jgi:hypothetical protein
MRDKIKDFVDLIAYLKNMWNEKAIGRQKQKYG